LQPLQHDWKILMKKSYQYIKMKALWHFQALNGIGTITLPIKIVEIFKNKIKWYQFENEGENVTNTL
jgi:hypothetical protein